MEVGLLEKWRRKWWSVTDTCQAEQDSLVNSVNSLELDSTAGPFILYGAATALALLLLLGERTVRTVWPAVRAMVTRPAVEV